MVYIEGPIGSGKTTRLIQEAFNLLTQHANESVLILCSNHFRQLAFQRALNQKISQVQKTIDSHTGIPIPSVYTYAGFVRTTLFDFWPLVEYQIIQSLKSTGASKIMPQLSGMEDTEFLLKFILQTLRAKDLVVFSDFTGTEQGLVKQLVRRIRLRSENRLTRETMTTRSQLLNEICIGETAAVEKSFDYYSYAFRMLDSNKQLDVFHSLLECNPILQNILKNRIKHLVVDDVDETIPAQQAFIQYLVPTLDTLILSADLEGGSRRGYLNAYPYDWVTLKQHKPGQTIRLHRDDPMAQNANQLLENWKKTENFQPLDQQVEVNDSFMSRVEMLDQLVEDIFKYLEEGYEPGHLTLVIPKPDSVSTYAIKSRLKKKGVNLQVLTGTHRPVDSPVGRGFLYLLQLANTKKWQTRLLPLEFKALLIHVLKLNQVDPQPLDHLVNLLAQSPQGELLTIIPPLEDVLEALPIPLTNAAQERYQGLFQWLQQAESLSFEKQMYQGFLKVVTPYATEKDHFYEIKQLIDSYQRQKKLYEGLKNLSGETALILPSQGQNHLTLSFEQFWIQLVKSGNVADTPEIPREIDPNAIILGTPQKIIDTEIARKIQLWLDVGSMEWSRTDNAPLYNAWVHSAVWDGDTTQFTEEFSEAIIRTRAGHITRTLMMLAEEKVVGYASEMDDYGFSQHGLLRPRMLSVADLETHSKPREKVILRPDQQPILKYQSGTMAVTAVPGAGKTFVNTQLILALIESGIAPDQILVLTYMDSAAKTLLQRLKGKMPPGIHQLPVVSTIHSLALRVLMENDHTVSQGLLPEELEILDEFGESELLALVAEKTKPEGQSRGSWQTAIRRGISHAKSHRLTVQQLEEAFTQMPQNFRLQDFIPAYRTYQQTLKERSQLDFTDLILNAIEILESSEETRQYYQEKFQYIIEDEAQDSSRLLQSFIHLLGGQNPNLVRTGDTNQSITTTFSSADTSVFREYIASADQVVQMTHSGRCAQEVMFLANHWIEKASQDLVLKASFQNVTMLPVEGVNPQLNYPITLETFELDREEEEWMVHRIQDIKKDFQDLTENMPSIAVLVRTNEQARWITGLLQSNEIPAICLGEQLNIHPVFTVLFNYLKLLLEPDSIEAQRHVYDGLVRADVISLNPQVRSFLETFPLLQQNPAHIHHEFLLQWYFDGQELSRDALGGDICHLLVRLTDMLFAHSDADSVSHRSNGYLCGLMAREILEKSPETDQWTPLEIVVNRFDEMVRKRRSKRSFDEGLSGNNAGFVQVMSLHKSKGQEFDVVFMPYLTQKYFPHGLEDVEFKETEKLVQTLDQILAKGPLPENYREITARAKLEEEARLLYVGITRARKGLFLSAHRSRYNHFGKLEQTAPAFGFRVFQEYLNQVSSPQEEMTIG